MSGTQLVRMDDWKKVREQFTESEKKALNEAICGEVMCPRGVVVTVNDVTKPILLRIKQVTGA